MSEKINPLHDYVLVESKATETVGSFVLAKTKEPDHGTVIAVGPGKYLPNGQREEMNLVPGQEVIFARDIIRRDEQKDGSVHLWMKVINVIGFKS